MPGRRHGRWQCGGIQYPAVDPLGPNLILNWEHKRKNHFTWVTTLMDRTPPPLLIDPLENSRPPVTGGIESYYFMEGCLKIGGLMDWAVDEQQCVRNKIEKHQIYK